MEMLHEIQIDPLQDILDFEGQPFAVAKESKPKEFMRLTLGAVLIDALLAPGVRIEMGDLSECPRRVELARKLAEKDVMKVSRNDAVLMQLLVNQTCKYPLVAAQALGALALSKEE